ncbi:MAG: hypothetical protein KatS3mg015_2561 [Fimbriimonadales bacterium]|nr:MAG: hypothetical protein KatS3mg015_2561 [Fimbriimonadales bacterium]
MAVAEPQAAAKLRVALLAEWVHTVRDALPPPRTQLPVTRPSAAREESTAAGMIPEAILQQHEPDLLAPEFQHLAEAARRAAGGQ